MTTWFKRFLNDLSTLSRIRFFAKYFLPVLILFFSLGVIGKLTQMNLTPKSLIANKGEVFSIGTAIEYGMTRRGTYKLYPLKILLYNSPNSFENFKTIDQFKNLFQEFRLIDNFSSDFFGIKDAIHQGDTITIYTRTGWQTLLGWGKQNNIYQIEKNNEVIFPISEMLEYQNRQMIIISIFLFVTIVGYLIYRLSGKEKVDKEHQISN